MIIRPYEYWESEKTINYMKIPTETIKRKLAKYYCDNFNRIAGSPYLAREQLEYFKFKKIKQLISYSYRNIPFYRDKYKKAGVNIKDINNLNDFKNIPLLTKDELIDAFPSLCVDFNNYNKEELYPTRSSGSSGKVVRLLYDINAVFEDTVHGIRQWNLQSGNKYKESHKVAMIYTCPWWFREINNKYRSYFISSLLSVDEIIDILKKLQPDIISCYPSVLERIISCTDNLPGTYLIVVHSEQSTKKQREKWSEQLSIPILDEYSSEEATRISLQLPCGNYHVCEDAVHLESLSIYNMDNSIEDEQGIAVVTNLLNTVMPIIRYIQGDLISLSSSASCSCGVTWKRLRSLDGRLNDSFITKDNNVIPSGVILDITYRWMMETDLNIKNFILSQLEFDKLELSITDQDYESVGFDRVYSLKNWLESIFGYSIILTCCKNYFDKKDKTIKNKPIRCLINTSHPRGEVLITSDFTNERCQRSGIRLAAS